MFPPALRRARNLEMSDRLLGLVLDGRASLDQWHDAYVRGLSGPPVYLDPSAGHCRLVAHPSLNARLVFGEPGLRRRH